MFERVARLGGTQRSLEGSLPASCTSDTSGVSNPTVNCEGDVPLPCSAEGKMPCVRRWRFAFERTAKLFVHVGMGHLNAGCVTFGQRLSTNFQGAIREIEREEGETERTPVLLTFCAGMGVHVRREAARSGE